MPRVRRDGGTSQSSTNPNRTFDSKGEASNGRSKSTINRLNMYKSGAPIRDRKGKIVGGDLLSRNKTGNKDMEKMARVAPNRRWFGNTRVISQKELDDFREKMSAKVADPYTVLLRRKALPMGLLLDANTGNGGRAVRERSDELIGDEFKMKMGANLLTTETFDSVFGPKKTRKRPKIAADSLQDLLNMAGKKQHEFDSGANGSSIPGLDALAAGVGLGAASKSAEQNISSGTGKERKIGREDIFSKGQSKRIWQELYKVIDSSDVLIQVLDARDPFGTRSKFLEQHLKTNCPHKHLIYILNKVDLVPNYLSKWYVKEISKEYPCLAFHASLTKPFGKGSLIALLRQFAALHPEKKQISVGFVGFPNVGKSSIINALKSKKVCKVAPIPGETKVWQYITLFKRVFLIDCPGVVYPDRSADKPDSDAKTSDYDRDLKYEAELVIKGVVRAERLESPEEYLDYILSKIQRKQLGQVYGQDIVDFKDAEDFMRKVATKRGRLLKGGEPDFRAVAQSLIYDLQRGILPYYVIPEECKAEKLERDALKNQPNEEQDMPGLDDE